MISFVVPAYNEERYLEATLRAIHSSARAAGELYEIVVADDASTDATSQIAERKNRAWLTREHDAAVELQAALIRKVQTMSQHEKASVSKPGFL